LESLREGRRVPRLDENKTKEFPLGTVEVFVGKGYQKNEKKKPKGNIIQRPKGGSGMRLRGSCRGGRSGGVRRGLTVCGSFKREEEKAPRMNPKSSWGDREKKRRTPALTSFAGLSTDQTPRGGTIEIYGKDPRANRKRNSEGYPHGPQKRA